MHYVKLHSAIWDNPKFLSLPGDGARLAYIRVLTAAKASDPEGQWPTRRYLEAQLRGDPWVIAHLDAIFAADLLDLDGEGRVTIRQWSFWQSWEGKRPAAQLATEAPAILEKRQKADARRKRIAYWVQKVSAEDEPIADVPQDIREDVARVSAIFSAETHDYTYGRTDGRTSPTETETPVGDSSSASSPPESDVMGERVLCPGCGFGIEAADPRYPGLASYQDDDGNLRHERCRPVESLPF